MSEKLKGQDILTDKDIILVTGGSGLFGKGIQEVVESTKVKGKWIFASSKDCDLSSKEATSKYFEKIKPTYVIHLAAYVGGLFRNSDPKERINFWIKNVNMNNNVLLCCNDFGVKKCMSALSTCIYPDKAKLPFSEKILHDGPPHQSNAPYAYAKRCLGLLSGWMNEIEAIKTQYLCCIPTNLYGKHDNFNVHEGHVIPGLIHKCYISKKEKKEFTVYGSGKPLRQFLYIIDAAKMLLLLFYNYDGKDGDVAVVPNVDDEISIGKVAETIVEKMEFKGKMVYDTSKADGQFKKTALNEKFMKMFPKFKFTKFGDGIKETVDWFVKNYDKCRK